ncbi:hypothetical protein [Enterobacter hormaechei]|uniref:hypothetical protein n=1 Tax=Enterobacter hormaechei TaxID=158836 RepID=UPI0038902317
MSIHYQSTVELARSELLDTPLKDAIGAINIPRLEELTALWGFAEAWQRVAPHIQMRDWLVSYSRMDEKCQARRTATQSRSANAESELCCFTQRKE